MNPFVLVFHVVDDDEMERGGKLVIMASARVISSWAGRGWKRDGQPCRQSVSRRRFVCYQASSAERNSVKSVLIANRDSARSYEAVQMASPPDTVWGGYPRRSGET
jgi:hypothetical protein